MRLCEERWDHSQFNVILSNVFYLQQRLGSHSAQRRPLPSPITITRPKPSWTSHLGRDIFPVGSGEHVGHEGGVDVVAGLQVAVDLVGVDRDAVVVEGNNVLVAEGNIYSLETRARR